MKIVYEKLNNFKSRPYLIKLDASWDDLNKCRSWLHKNLGPESGVGNYLVRYVDDYNNKSQPEKEFWANPKYYKRMEILFTREEDVIAFKLTFEE